MQTARVTRLSRQQLCDKGKGGGGSSYVTWPRNMQILMWDFKLRQC